MNCPNCHSSNTAITDTRSDGNSIRGRRYRCGKCRLNFDTIVREEIEPEVAGKHTIYSLLNSLHVMDTRKRTNYVYVRSEHGREIDHRTKARNRQTTKGKIAVANNNARRRGRVKNGGSFTAAEWLAKQKEYGNRCAACGAETKLQVDHKIPLALGGSNRIKNIQPLCRNCNARKGASIITVDASLQHTDSTVSV